MPSQYEALPTADDREEVNFVIEDSDDEQDQQHGTQDRAPLLAKPASSSTHHVGEDPDSPPGSPIDTRLSFSAPAPAPPGGFDYSYPPPPHSPTAYGNDNGLAPESPVIAGPSRPSVFRRALAAVLPSHYIRDQRGGGVGNDGVFANMAAKPGGPTPERESENVNPPSYAAAQADAVPPYWETALSGISNALNADGEMVVDGLATGSLFSFLWNLLVSMSFQAIGFLLTYLLHTTHAAKYGSRAGLGVTLIQYGFSMRSRLDDPDMGAQGGWGWPVPETAAEPKPTFDSMDDARKYYEALANNATNPANATAVSEYIEDAAKIDAALRASASTATEWLSFALMTCGWFILLTSLLGYWKVKRYERGVRQAAQEASNPTAPPSTEQLAAARSRLLGRIEAAFHRASDRLTDGTQRGAERIRVGLGLPTNREAQ